MTPPYTLHFVLNRDKLKNGLHPIYGRIRMDGITAAFVTGKAVRPEDWDVEMNQVKKSHPEHAIINAHLEEFRLKVRCYTGMAFADIKNLKQESIIHNIDGSIWIIYHRQKTKIIAKIKLLKTAISILEKYSTDTSLVFPKIPDNGTCNKSLKQVAKEAKITKHLTYHMARHTFATTITLSNGVPIETVSKMLGHKNLHTTQIYARILDSKISADMDELERKLSMH